MANWTDLSGAFAYGTKLTSAQQGQLRDNITALAEGASGAPSIQGAAIGNDQIDSQHYAADSIDTEHYAPASVDQTALGANCVGQSEIKEGSGNASASLGPSALDDIAMQDYSFFPNMGGITIPGMFSIYAYSSTAATYVGRFAIKNNDGGTPRIYTIYWRYITATDEHFIYSIRDKATGKIVATWACTDPPSECWGMDKKPDDFVPPIIRSEPPEFMEEIVLFKYPKESYNELINKSKTDKIDICTLLDQYDYDEKIKIFKSKNLVHI